VVKITAIAFGWIGFTTAFASVAKKPYRRSGLLRLLGRIRESLPGANSQIFGARSQDLHAGPW
jgi:hypothetical protein